VYLTIGGQKVQLTLRGVNEGEVLARMTAAIAQYSQR
jgi:hypothetical protein